MVPGDRAEAEVGWSPITSNFHHSHGAWKSARPAAHATTPTLGRWSLEDHKIKLGSQWAAALLQNEQKIRKEFVIAECAKALRQGQRRKSQKWGHTT